MSSEKYSHTSNEDNIVVSSLAKLDLCTVSGRQNENYSPKTCFLYLENGRVAFSFGPSDGMVYIWHGEDPKKSAVIYRSNREKPTSLKVDTNRLRAAKSTSKICYGNRESFR